MNLIFEGIFYKHFGVFLSMENFLLLKRTPVLEELSQTLGFSRALFAGAEFIVINSLNKREVLQSVLHAKQRKQRTIYRATTEEMLRFVLEKTDSDMVYGQEFIHAQDSLHFLRSGLDQILCTIAAQRQKTIAFSFHDILNSSHRAKLLGRIAFNIRLCKKYKVPMLFSTFAENESELRSAQDLQAFWRVLER